MSASREREREAMPGRRPGNQFCLRSLPPSAYIGPESQPAAAVHLFSVFSDLTTMRALTLTLALILISLLLSVQAKRSTTYEDKPFGEF